MIFKKVSFFQYCKDFNYDTSLWSNDSDVIYTKKQIEEKEKKHPNYQEWATLLQSAFSLQSKTDVHHVERFQ